MEKELADLQKELEKLLSYANLKVVLDLKNQINSYKYKSIGVFIDKDQKL